MFIAEREGFEPPERCRSTVFKTAVIDHSTTSPVFSAVWRQNRLFHEMECKDSKNLIPVKKKMSFSVFRPGTSCRTGSEHDRGGYIPEDPHCRPGGNLRSGTVHIDNGTHLTVPYFHPLGVPGEAWGRDHGYRHTVRPDRRP